MRKHVESRSKIVNDIVSMKLFVFDGFNRRIITF